MKNIEITNRLAATDAMKRHLREGDENASVSLEKVAGTNGYGRYELRSPLKIDTGKWYGTSRVLCQLRCKEDHCLSVSSSLTPRSVSSGPQAVFILVLPARLEI